MIYPKNWLEWLIFKDLPFGAGWGCQKLVWWGKQRLFMPTAANHVAAHGIHTVIIWGAAITPFSPPAGQPTNRGNHPAEQPPAGQSSNRAVIQQVPTQPNSPIEKCVVSILAAPALMWIRPHRQGYASRTPPIYDMPRQAHQLRVSIIFHQSLLARTPQTRLASVQQIAS